MQLHVLIPLALTHSHAQQHNIFPKLQLKPDKKEITAKLKV